MEEQTGRELRKCAFCGRTEREVAFLIPGIDRKTYICDNCIELCSDFIDEHLSGMESEDEDKLTFETLPARERSRKCLTLTL